MNETAHLLAGILERIPAPDPAATQHARAHLDTLTKPLGSLGRLEDLAAQLITINPSLAAEPLRMAVYVFAADHGIVAEGVSAYPAEVTTQMVLNFLAAGAAINVLARLHRAAIHIVDCGVAGDLPEHPLLIQGKIARGTRNMLHEPAMSDEELHAAVLLGISMADRAAAKGYTCVALGEMGIGNTSSASLLTAALTGNNVADVTGRGTGLSDEAYSRKVSTLTGVISRHSADLRTSCPTYGAASPRRMRVATDTLTHLRSLGGFEIATMSAFYLQAATHRIALVCDGFISTAAAAVALHIAPELRPYLFAGHRSQEPGHRILLNQMHLQPILQLDLRLGEGTGAVLAMPILDSALHLYCEMATFTSAQVTTAL